MLDLLTAVVSVVGLKYFPYTKMGTASGALTLVPELSMKVKRLVVPILTSIENITKTDLEPILIVLVRALL